jgi:hypothetical protein
MSLMIIGLNVAATTLTTTYADDKNCKKNDDNNCNEIKKIQKSSPNVECEVDTEIKDRNKNSIVRPTDLQCNSNSQSLIDSNIQSSLDDGGGGNEPPPVITLIPNTGPAGNVVNVFGSNFDSNVQVSIFFDGTRVAVALPDTNGNFSADFKVFTPILGPHTVTAFQSLGSTSATFTVTSGPPIVQLDPTSGPAGISVNITGINFDTDSVVNILYDGDIVQTTPAVVHTNSLGVFSAFFTVPGGVLGGHTVNAADISDPSAAAGDIFTQTASVTTSTEQQPSTDASTGSPSINTPTQGMLPF